MTLHNTLWRNLAIVGLVAAALTAAGEGGSQVTEILFLILRVAFLLALGWLALDGLAPEPRHVPADAACARRRCSTARSSGSSLLVVTADLWASSSPLASLVFFAALGGCGYLLYRGWQESRRYYY